MSATGSCSDAPSGDGWHLLFVYGTLKTGEKNNRLLETPRGNGRARLLGAAQTLEKLPLVVATEYNVPFLLAAKGTGEIVEGELYEIDAEMLEFCDWFEEHPEVYQRTVISVRLTQGDAAPRGVEGGAVGVTPRSVGVASGASLSCVAYLMENFPRKWLELPHLACFRSTPDQPYTHEGENKDGSLEKYLKRTEPEFQMHSDWIQSHGATDPQAK